MATVRYMGRASRVRIPGGLVLDRGVVVTVSDLVADGVDGLAGFIVTRTAPPAVPAPQARARSRPAKAVAPEPAAPDPETVAEPVAADPASSSGVDADDTVAAPVVDAQPDAAEGDQGG